jgi:hypothetical protein
MICELGTSYTKKNTTSKIVHKLQYIHKAPIKYPIYDIWYMICKIGASYTKKYNMEIVCKL